MMDIYLHLPVMKLSVPTHHPLRLLSRLVCPVTVLDLVALMPDISQAGALYEYRNTLWMMMRPTRECDASISLNNKQICRSSSSYTFFLFQAIDLYVEITV